MELSTVLKELVKKQENILNEFDYNVEEAENNENYYIINKAIEEIVKGINKVTNQEILISSYIFVNEEFEDYSLSELIDQELVCKALEIECVVEK